MRVIGVGGRWEGIREGLNMADSGGQMAAVRRSDTMFVLTEYYDLKFVTRFF